MSDPIQTVCSLTGCTEEEAKQALNQTEDIVDAVDHLLEKKPSPAEKFLTGKKRPREVTPEEEIIRPIRTMMKEFDEKTSTLLYRPLREEPAEKRDPLVEKVLQSSYFQECQLPSLESEAEKQETACQSQFGCSSCSQSNGQTQPCSDRQCPQLSQVQGKE
jgi:hypothetical protein